MSEFNSCSSSSPIRVHFSDVTNKKNLTNDDDRRWKLLNGKTKKKQRTRLFYLKILFTFSCTNNNN